MKSVLKMGTVVRFKLCTQVPQVEAEAALERALRAFQLVEEACSRFDESSELRQLCRQLGEPVPVSDVLFETLKFALTVAELTHGVFDPAVGRVLHAHGFRRHYLTGALVSDEFDEPGAASYKDIVLNMERRTVLLKRPLTLDLGAVAKGFAVDLAVRELKPFEGFVIDAGGDVYVGGTNEYGERWRVGIRHPVRTEDTLCTLQAADAAVCTSGGYERVSPTNKGQHHLIDPHTGASPKTVLSSTVLAPYGMMADAFSTAAFLLGPRAGLQLLEQVGLEGLLVDESLTLHMTKGMKEFLYVESSAIKETAAKSSGQVFENA